MSTGFNTYSLFLAPNKTTLCLPREPLPDHPSSRIHDFSPPEELPSFSPIQSLPIADAAPRQFTIVTVDLGTGNPIAPPDRPVEILPTHIPENRVRVIPLTTRTGILPSSTRFAFITTVATLAGALLISHGALSLSDREFSSITAEPDALSITSIALGVLIFAVTALSVKRHCSHPRLHATVAPASTLAARETF